MKKPLFYSILLFSLVFIFTLNLLSPLACKQNTIPVLWQNLYKDEEWLKSVNRYLGLAYVERQDKAGFTELDWRDLLPALYSTHYIIRILESSGIEIENKNQIAEYVNSLLGEQGAFHDPLWHSDKWITEETMRAISTLTYLEIPPENIDLTIDYLLSLKYDDGTFLLNAEEGISTLEETRLRRISYGTYPVVSSLIMLGQIDRIPEETIDVIETEISNVLAEGNVFLEPHGGDAAGLISAIELLSRIDPTLVTERAREFITHELELVADMPADPFLFSAKVNKLLNVAELLQLPAGQDENILNRLRVYMKEKVFPMQNLTGGFGPSDTIEPMTTAENVILANRLGVTYPDLDKLMSELDKHWVGNGWTVFTIPALDKDNYEISYHALEIANFSGFTDFDSDKLESFLEECFTSRTVGTETVSLRNVYYAIMALKTLNGKLTKEQAQNAKEICLSLSKKLVSASETEVTSNFAYTVLISEEVGFELPEEVKIVVSRLAANFKEALLNGERVLIPYYLFLLWESMKSDKAIITKSELTECLDSLYDRNSGVYNTIAIVEMPASPDEEPEYGPRPEMNETYYALQLLLDIGEDVPDKDKAVNFVLSSKLRFGFSRAPDWPDPNLEATFAAVLILNLLSQ